MFILFDSEGVILRTGGTTNNKETTYYVTEIAIIILGPNKDIITKELFQINCWLPQYAFEQFIKQQSFCKTNYPLMDGGYELDYIINLLQEYYSCGFEFYSKGTALENRLLNGIGLQGNTAHIKECVFDRRVKEINCPKYIERVHNPLKELEFFYSFF